MDESFTELYLGEVISVIMFKPPERLKYTILNISIPGDQTHLFLKEPSS